MLSSQLPRPLLAQPLTAGFPAPTNRRNGSLENDRLSNRRRSNGPSLLRRTRPTDIRISRRNRSHTRAAERCVGRFVGWLAPISPPGNCGRARSDVHASLEGAGRAQCTDYTYSLRLPYHVVAECGGEGGEV